MKKYLIGIFALLLALSLFSCSASPTAIRVGANKVDASEYAYYLNYNRLNLDALSLGAAVLNTEELLAEARRQAKEHIVTAEIVRIKCKELGLELTREQKAQMEDEKQQLIDSFGGLSGYLDYLNQNALTDRLYDKLQENSYYYSMLYDHIAQNPSSGVQTDQQLRQFFAENYIRVRYIRFSTLTAEGTLMETGQLDALMETAEAVLAQINSGETTFEQAMSQYNDDVTMADNPSGLVLGTQDGTVGEYSADAFALSDGQVGGVYTYSDGYYIIERQAADVSYFDENRQQITLSASDWAFNNYINEARDAISITENGVCQKINFENLAEYIK